MSKVESKKRDRKDSFLFFGQLKIKQLIGIKNWKERSLKQVKTLYFTSISSDHKESLDVKKIEMKTAKMDTH